MEPIIRFSWNGAGEPKEVFLYMLPEGTLADDDTRVQLCVQVQDAAARSAGLSTFEASIKALAGENDLEATFYALPDHSDPLDQRVSIGLRPRPKPPEPQIAWE